MTSRTKHDRNAGLAQTVVAGADIVDVADHEREVMQLVLLGAGDAERMMVGARIAAQEGDLIRLVVIALDVIGNPEAELLREKRKRLLEMGNVHDGMPETQDLRHARLIRCGRALDTAIQLELNATARNPKPES